MGPPGNRGSCGSCVLAQTQKTYEKGTRGISWGPLLTPGPRAVTEFPNGQSAPGENVFCYIYLVKITQISVYYLVCRKVIESTTTMAYCISEN
ncbi:unnamed protein product [Staurois parvus]|uniref:Uncharacterized protein n=1 Tax=Staurois parvus TaxID=386267 RepID=A0ABN9AKQ5_9NEOB|nr:unnamed protein product [Staurois parvus]